jgi:tetratricopeptide (TPR) repeat protein
MLVQEIERNMKKTLRAAAVAAMLVPTALTFTGCNKLKARDQLNKGVQSYKSMHYEQAIENFKNAVNLDPNLPVARLYLATAYASSYVPGVDTPENNQNANQAIDNFKQVIDQKDTDKQTRVASLKGIASILFNQKKLSDAKDYQKKIIAEDPNDAEAHYTIGVIDWTDAFKRDQEARAKLNITKGEDPIKDKNACQDLKSKNDPVVAEGIDELNKAMQARADYDDAMAYMNLMYRQKADIECGNADARAADLKQADDWSNKTMQTKKIKAEKAQSQGGIVLDNNQQSSNK